jgi:ligand-binding sensor domain-containing protein
MNLQRLNPASLRPRLTFVLPLTWFVLIMVTTVTQVVAQGLPFKNYSIQSGLSQSVVNHIQQDTEGYIWIATEYGLNRFNKFRFDNYFTEHGLSHNNVLVVFQNRFGELLAGTENGLDVKRNGRFVRYPGSEILRGVPVVALHEDPEGGLWVGTSGQGLYYFRDDSFQYFNRENGLADDIIRKIIDLPDQRVAVATRGGISVISHAERRVLQNYDTQDGLSEQRTRDILLHSDGSIWIGTRDGISIFENGELRYLNVSDGLVHPRVTSMTQDELQGVWIATEGGVSHYINGRFHNYTDANGLANNIVTTVFRDFENNMWFGTYGGGADMLSGEKFLLYSVQQGLLSNMITSFAEASDGYVWIGTYGGGLARVNGPEVSLFSTQQNLIDTRVYTLSLTRDGSVWVGTRNGVSRIQNNRILPGNALPGLPDPKVRSILEDSRGDLWVATYGGGIARYRNGALLRVYDTSSGLPDNIVMHLIEASDGTVWAATYGGVAIIDNSSVRTLTIDDGLIQNSVITVFEDSIGQIWIGTFAGISVYFAGTLRNITTADGLPNNVAYFFGEDERGFIWIGTNNGLVRYDIRLQADENDPDRIRDRVRFKAYTTETGLASNEMNANSFMMDSRGNFWLGTVGGANHFRWRLESELTVGPPVHIEQIRLFEEPRDIDSGVFSHDENFLAFDFVGISFSNPGSVLYEYRLRGVDQTWQRTTQRTVRYTTLPHGEYRFEVRARNSDGFWSPQRATVTFKINPPFWRTWWFYSLLSMAILFVIGFVYNYFKISRLVDLERIRIRIASDLHDDVGASLTEIALQADFLQATMKDPAIGESLHQMGEMSRKIVTTMDDIVWSIDARNDTWGDLLDRMQDYASNVLLHRGIEPHFEFKGIETDKVVKLEHRQNLYLIYKEAVNNAAKHSQATQMNISLTIESGSYTLRIQDNGVGLPEKTRSGGHGLKNMKLRAERIKAGLEYVNNHGLTITVSGKGL